MLWDTTAAGSAVLGATHLASTDLDYSRALFGDVLDANVSTSPTGVELAWPSGTILVHHDDRAGVLGMDLHHAPPSGLRIGEALLGSHIHSRT